ncbi:hypothetical protein ACIF70_20590 [Actinacidiphila glaucinigra]|uniref:hypothetical protein n=1 Tax=Actinacidiphila glaucinigra TaxID=235986 RepID=UPI0037C5BE15
MIPSRLRRAAHRAVLVACALVMAAAAAPATVSQADSGSAMTVSGKGDFAGLKVTVDQTSSLVNQVVKITWKGAVPTVDDSKYPADYLQIMQCWGDAPSGPSPEQCQFGGSADLGAGTGGQAAGAWTNTRQLSYGGLKDPAQTLPPPATGSNISFAPFRAVSGDVFDTGNSNEFFDSNTTNEVPYARTGSSGTGEVYFEVQTAAESPGLGCGDVPKGKTGGRSCWLVVVPRGETEVDGTSYRSQSDGLLQSSPLSATNWKERLVFPLRFERAGTYCPIGAAERPTLGTELVAEAVHRWQPTLCQTGSKTIYGFSPAGDAGARENLTTDEPGMVFLNRAADRSALLPDAKPIYAPVALSGLTLGFFVESHAASSASEDVRARNGNRLTSLNLTARLVAKLLTESYQDGNSRFAESTAKNPYNLGHDPEFIKYNPDYEDLDFLGALGDALVPQPLSDATSQLWSWIDSDPAAREFLDGTPDNEGSHGDPGFSGMTVNPYYKDLDLPVDGFPKSDPYCQQFPDHPDQPLCILDKHPYATDLHNAARSAARGDTLARGNWDPTTKPPAYKKDPPQPAGRRAMLAVTDTATARRYGLVTAKLQNASGDFVAPTDATMLAAQKAMKPGPVSGVLVSDPRAAVKDAYPLTLLTYAATVPEKLSKQEGRDYAALLRYAVGKGQVPGVTAGTLPDGFAPLPASLREQTESAADAIASRSGPSAPEEEEAVDGTGDGTGGGGGQTVVPPPASTPSPSSSPSTQASTPAPPVPVAAEGPLSRTPEWVLGAVRYVLLIALLAGLVAAVCGPLLPRVAPRLAAGIQTWRAKGTAGREPRG